MRGGSERLAGELSVIVPDGDGVPGRVSKPCQILPGQETTVRLITRFGHVDSDLKAVFHIGREVIARKTFETTAMQADADHFLPALESQSLIVVVGDSTLGMDEVGKLGGGEPEARPVAVRLDDIERLPTHWCGYEGVDAVILCTSRPEIYRRLAANNARVQALDQWVRMGGRLVLCVGSQADEILAQNSPLRRVRPRPAGKDGLAAQTRGVGNVLPEAASSVSAAGGGKAVMRVPQLADVQGTVEAAEADLPLVVRTARGFGQVIFVAGDLGPAAAGEMVRPAAAAGQTARPAHRSRRGVQRKRGRDALRLQRSGRPVAQCARPVHRRPAGAVLARGGPDRGLHPSDRAGRLLLPPQSGPAHGMDVADVSRDRGAGEPGRLRAGLLAQGRSTAGA